MRRTRCWVCGGLFDTVYQGSDEEDNQWLCPEHYFLRYKDASFPRERKAERERQYVKRWKETSGE